MKPINKNKTGAKANTEVASFFSSKKGAMEMSMGTIVTIVLLMSVLILGLVMVKSIFKSSTGAIDGIDQAMKGEMSKMFSDDASKRVVVYPKEGRITIKKGEDTLGFGFAIRNLDLDENEGGAIFSYKIESTQNDCGMTDQKADSFLTLGKEDEGLFIYAGDIMEDMIFVRFKIPENAPPCEIRYKVKVFVDNNQPYGSSSPTMDLLIKSK